MKKYDISDEDHRIYVYDGGVEYKIEDPVDLYIADSGGHRVLDVNGYIHCPSRPWLAIVWFTNNEEKVQF